MDESRKERTTGEVLLVWALITASAFAVLVTYSRLDPEQLYHVSESGLTGGLGRALVVLNFPLALIAIGVVGVLLERGAPRAPAILAVALCAAVVWPGVVDQDDLDAKLVNAVPALGVAIAGALTVHARPTSALERRRSLDAVRIVLAVVVLVGGIPWLFAEVGAYGPNPILADEVPTGEELAAVHLGHHHGTDGVVLTLSALLLSRVVRTSVLRGYVALMLVYGFANALQDFWFEQLVKRGTFDVEIPSVLVPKPTVAWAVLLVASAAVYAFVLSREARAG